MLADVVLQAGSSILRMAEVMRCNQLGVLRPSYHPRCCACTEHVCTPKPFSMWYQNWGNVNRVGRRVGFTELEFNLMTPESFRCYRSLLAPEVDPLGWSALPLFPFACAQHCQGILDETTMYDSSIGAYDYNAVSNRVRLNEARNSNPSVAEHSWGLLMEPRDRCRSRALAPEQAWPMLVHEDQALVRPELEDAVRARLGLPPS